VSDAGPTPQVLDIGPTGAIVATYTLST